MYKKISLMALFSFVSMYILMYIMVDHYSNVYSNLNQFYMAAIMTLPMVFFELLLMSKHMDNKKNGLLLACLVAFTLLIVLIRRQVGIHDKEFLRSMIPHHAGALLMCKNATLSDPELENLCKSISSSQQREIDFMQAKLASLK